MYQFSLTYFKKLFGFVITNTEKSSSLDTRISNLLNAITETIYSNVCRGLFNQHKRIFSFLMAAKIYMKSGAII
jgi:dynein heavy chain